MNENECLTLFCHYFALIFHNKGLPFLPFLPFFLCCQMTQANSWFQVFGLWRDFSAKISGVYLKIIS